MSRYKLPQEQIDNMNMDTVSELLLHIQDELCELTDTEYRLYTKRRELEKVLHPEVFIEPELLQTTESELKRLLQEAVLQGINIKDLTL